jgi:hypothetical protein
MLKNEITKKYNPNISVADRKMYVSVLNPSLSSLRRIPSALTISLEFCDEYSDTTWFAVKYPIIPLRIFLICLCNEVLRNNMTHSAPNVTNG